CAGRDATWPSGGERGGQPRQTAPLAPARQPHCLAALEVLLECRREPATGEGGTARECGGVTCAGGEEDERLQELRAADDTDDGVLGAIEVVGQRFRLTRLTGEVVAHVAHAVGDRARHVMRRQGAEQTIRTGIAPGGP